MSYEPGSARYLGDVHGAYAFGRRDHDVQLGAIVARGQQA